MIFPFKITNQTQNLDLWFSFFPFRNHKHKHKLTWLRRIEPRKKKWRTRWSKVVSRLWPWARKIRGAEDCAIVWDLWWRGRNGVDRVESLGSVTLTELGTAVRVGRVMRELAKGEIESEWDCDLWVREWDCVSETEENREERGGLCELKMSNRNFRVYNIIYM